MANHLPQAVPGYFAALNQLERFLLNAGQDRLGKPEPMLIRRLLLPLVGLALLAGLSGCATLAAVPAIAVYAGVEGVSLNQTGKLASDHAVSAITGQDCSFLRYKDTGNYCRSAAEIAASEAIARRDLSGYCYRRRGQVTCYTTPDPTASDEIRVH
jgi:hypothetical protein